MLSEIQAGTMIPGEWIITVIVAVIGALGGIYLKRTGVAQGRAEQSTVIANEPLSIAITQTLATKDELEALEQRIMEELKKLEGSLSNERAVARNADGNLHARINKAVEGMAEMKGELHQINANLSRLIDMAIGNGGKSKPGPRSI